MACLILRGHGGAGVPEEGREIERWSLVNATCISPFLNIKPGLFLGRKEIGLSLPRIGFDVTFRATEIPLLLARWPRP